jgi:GTP diphosphokinase / guanosine-3',5'-bis(diphosphate) 3'-diphosphatase
MPEAIIEEEEKKLITDAYRALLKSIRAELTPEDKLYMRKAFDMAVEAHARQRRKSGEPYILHPLAVARICAEELGLGATSVVAAILHDVVEDTEITLEDIKDEFGPKVASLVDGLTKLDAVYDSRSPQAENLKKVITTLVDDVRVVLVKMADRLHNLRTIGSMPRHKQLRIAAETNFIYAPLAHRLGLYNLKTELQDLCLKITNPDEYQDIAGKLSETKQERTDYIAKFITELQEGLDEIGIPYRIFGRAKSIFSIWNKLQGKGVTFEEIYDLFAIRIVLDTPPKKEKAACWTAFSVVTDVYNIRQDRMKDWITQPKSNGYESLHCTVLGPGGKFVEVQIRTERMDEIAERGFAAHWKYKGVGNQQDVYESWFDNIREMVDNNSLDALEFVHDFKSALFNEEVYVHTPKGDLKVLPKGATALDFAFSIHSDVGHHCAAVKVNNKLVPMGYELQNGDQITVITNKNQKPNESWLKICVTGKAKTKIRQALKEDGRKNSDLGREALERKLNNLKVDFEENVDMLAQFFGYSSRSDFYSAIANDKVTLSDLTKSFTIDSGRLIGNSIKEKPTAPIHQTSIGQKIAKDIKGKLIIQDQSADDIEYAMAPCCNPVFGDDIFAYNSATGIRIHKMSCPNANFLMANFSYRILPSRWVDQEERNFTAMLLIEGLDSGPGVIERVSSHISNQLGLNIKSFYIDGYEGIFEGKVSLIVNERHQLEMAIENLKSLEGIVNVTRIA